MGLSQSSEAASRFRFIQRGCGPPAQHAGGAKWNLWIRHRVCYTPIVLAPPPGLQDLGSLLSTTWYTDAVCLPGYGTGARVLRTCSKLGKVLNLSLRLATLPWCQSRSPMVSLQAHTQHPNLRVPSPALPCMSEYLKCYPVRLRLS